MANHPQRSAPKTRNSRTDMPELWATPVCTHQTHTLGNAILKTIPKFRNRQPGASVQDVMSLCRSTFFVFVLSIAAAFAQTTAPADADKPPVSSVPSPKAAEPALGSLPISSTIVTISRITPARMPGSTSSCRCGIWCSDRWAIQRELAVSPGEANKRHSR
jgi:hypothetical protein